MYNTYPTYVIYNIYPKALRAHSATVHCTLEQINYVQIIFYSEFASQAVDRCTSRTKVVSCEHA